MSDTAYHVRIKKEYASVILENLLQVDAIEIIEDDVPEWQQKETLQRLQKMKENSNESVSHEDVLKLLNDNNHQNKKIRHINMQRIKQKN